MTTYSYNLTLNDSESIALKAALDLMIKTCEENLAKGEISTNEAHKRLAENILSRLYDNTAQTSGNNF